MHLSPGQDQFMKINFARINMTKLTIVTLSFLCFLCAPAAFGQTAAVLSSTAQPLQMPDHVQHASTHAMAMESSLFSATSPYSYAQGEVPLAELGSPIYQTPLGDIARSCRQEHAMATKAAVVFEQVGDAKN
jgi:hypothetical protein